MSMKVQGIEQNVDAAKQTQAQRNVESLQPKPGSQSSGTSTNKGGGENVQLSERGQMMVQAQAELASMPEIDQKRVDELKAQINNGNYKTDSKEIANKLIQEAAFGILT